MQLNLHLPLHLLNLFYELLMAQRAEIEVVIRRFYGAFQPGEANALHETVSPEWVDHTLPPGRDPGLAGMVKALEQLHHLVPDLQTKIVKLLIDGDYASVHIRFSGTHGGDFRGVPPSHRPIEFLAFDIHHVAGEQIVESWHLEDNLAFLVQIGALPAL